MNITNGSHSSHTVNPKPIDLEEKLKIEETRNNYMALKKLIDLIIKIFVIGLIIGLILFIIFIVRQSIVVYVIMQRPFNATEFVPYAVAYLIAGYTIFLIPVTTAVFPLLISVAYFIKKDSIFEKNIPEAIMKVLQFVLTLTIVAVVISFIGSVLANDAILKPEQISWITFMAILLTFGLLNDPMNEAGIRTDLIISKNGFKNIICQSLYQIAVLLVIYFLAMLFIPNVKDGRMADPDSPPSVHYTLIFNTFCLMTLFNALNSRKVYGERNIFQGLNKNKTFCIIWIILFVLQVLLIQFGGDYYSTAPLNIIHWGVCIAFGVGVLIWGQIIATIRCK